MSNYNSITESIIGKAYKFAKQKHAGQKYGDHPSIYHPTQVAKVIKLLCPTDHNLIAAAYLHDTMEDCGVTREELIREFNEDIATLVWEVTKTGSNTFTNLKSLRATILKLADRTANYSNAGERTDKGPEWLEGYLKKVAWRTE